MQGIPECVLAGRQSKGPCTHINRDECVCKQDTHSSHGGRNALHYSPLNLITQTPSIHCVQVRVCAPREEEHSRAKKTREGGRKERRGEEGRVIVHERREIISE